MRWNTFAKMFPGLARRLRAWVPPAMMVPKDGLAELIGILEHAQIQGRQAATPDEEARLSLATGVLPEIPPEGPFYISMSQLEILANCQRVWSEATFGRGLYARSIQDGIFRELSRHEMMLPEPWVLVILLAMDGYTRSGGKPEELLGRLISAFQERARKFPSASLPSFPRGAKHDQ